MRRRLCLVGVATAGLPLDAGDESRGRFGVGCSALPPAGATVAGRDLWLVGVMPEGEKRA